MHLRSHLCRALLLSGVPGLASGQAAPARTTHPAANAVAGTCTVATVIDGDTLRCSDGRRVRLIGIDAPEKDQAPFGAEARAALERLAPRGSTLNVVLDVVPADRFGRTLAYLQTGDGTFVNVAMARSGFAVQLTIPPNVAHAMAIQRAVEMARAAGAGLWAQHGFTCAPSAHRGGRC